MAAKTKRAMNPILFKELRLGSRSIRLPITVMIYDIVLAIIAVVTIAIATYAGTAISGRVDYSAFLSIYQVIGWTQLGITLLIVPILTAGSISGEREKQTLDIMLTTPKKPLSIVWGKLLAAISNYMIYILSSIPIMAIAFVLGGLNWFALLGYIGMMLVVVVYVGSVGVFCSSCFKKTIASIVMTFLLTSLLFAIPVILFFGLYVLIGSIWEVYYYSYASSTTATLNLGALPFIMIGNPLTGFLDYMLWSMDVSSIAELLNDAGIFGKIVPILARAWTPLNIVASLATSWFFLYMAGRKLNPLKKRKRRRRPHPVMPPQQAGMGAVPSGAPVMWKTAPQPQGAAGTPQPLIPNAAVQPQGAAGTPQPLIPNAAILPAGEVGAAAPPQPSGTTEKLKREETR